MRKTLLISMLLALTPALLLGDNERLSRYQGRVYYEISIDDDGIFLTDSTGEVFEIPFSETDSYDSPDMGPDGAGGLFDDCPKVLDKITRIGGSVVLSEDECVIGDVVVMGGNAIIRGKVGGSVTATGRVRIGTNALVMGRVDGREVIVESGGDVWGDIHETDITGKFPDLDIKPESSGTVVVLTIILIQLVVVLLVALIFAKGTDRVTDALRTNVFKALLVGFLAEILLLPAFILLLITIIGIPVALIGIPLAVVGAALMGLAAFCLYVSDFVRARNDEEEESRLMKLLTGYAILQVPLVGQLFCEVINVELLSVLFGIVAALLMFIVFTSSLGAVILTRFGTREYTATETGGRVHVEIS